MKISKEEEEIWDQQTEIFESLVERIEVQLKQFGTSDGREPGDYSIYEDYMGHPQVKVSMLDLKMLRPPVIEALRRVAKMYPGWEIVVAVVINGHRDWPRMGLFVRHDVIIDGLQRQHFPEDFQNISYPGARPGDESDSIVPGPVEI